MIIGICFILELAGHEPAMRPRELDGLVDHSHGAFGCRCYNHLCSEKPHQLAPFDAEGLCHGDDQGISLGSADHRKADSSIPARRFDDRLASLQLARFFGCFDDTKSQPIFHRTKWVEGFNLYEQIYAVWRKTIDPYHRRVTNRFDDALIFLSHVGSDIALMLAKAS